MDFERELTRLAEAYAGRGYLVVVRPGPDELPPFARDFRIEILARRGAESVLVAARLDLVDVAEDSDLDRYAEITPTHDGWRFDLAILGESRAGTRDLGEAREWTEAEIKASFEEATRMVAAGFSRPAILTAWAGLEAAMRLKLRAEGEAAGRGTSPRTLLNESYSMGLVDSEEFRKIEDLFRARNQIAHGFLSSLADDGGAVQFLSDAGRRLIERSRDAAVPA